MSGSRFVQPFVLSQPGTTLLQPAMMTSQGIPILAIQMPSNPSNGKPIETVMSQPPQVEYATIG
jgi:hypothetical protein